jgi:AAA domain
MRIAFTGTQSTGKSTIIGWFTGYPDSYELIRKVGRSVIADGLPLGKRASVSAYSLYVARQLKLEVNFDPRHGRHLISDRCLVDVLAHARVNEAIAVQEYPPHFIESLKEITRFSLLQYDVVAYFPIEFAQEDDGVREPDEDYRHRVASEMELILEELELRTVTVTGTRDHRLQQILDLGVAPDPAKQRSNRASESM